MKMCPYCNVKFINLEHFDTTVTMSKSVILDYSGVCPNCNREYTWEETYLYVDETEPEEID